MFLRKVVISSDCQNGPIEIITDDFNGILFKENDEAECVTKIKNLLLNKDYNSDKIRNIKLNALKTSKKFTIFNHYKEFIKHIY